MPQSFSAPKSFPKIARYSQPKITVQEVNSGRQEEKIQQFNQEQQNKQEQQYKQEQSYKREQQHKQEQQKQRDQQQKRNTNKQQSSPESSVDDLYTILGVPKNATAAEIKKAYHQKAIENHPDRNPQNREAAEHKFKTINDAYKILSTSMIFTFFCTIWKILPARYQNHSPICH
eukprot:Phypoly_transcript_18243.p1 GENE.Phypoly_transcript_18243~~Phypoly_transcript_18243.p1  ORF type:complete len:174 (+),score=27.29 Phypoly_transcript_18243:63-584(+)